jgi:hypothetical protein
MELQTADKEEFLRSILGRRPFCKEYSLFRGTITAVFRSLTVEEANTLNRFEDENFELLAEGNELSQLRLWFHTSCIKTASGVLLQPSNICSLSFEETKMEYKKQFSCMDDTVFQAILKAHNDFIDTLLSLRNGGLDPNF